jgi:hypothetical protein
VATTEAETFATPLHRGESRAYSVNIQADLANMLVNNPPRLLREQGGLSEIAMILLAGLLAGLLPLLAPQPVGDSAGEDESIERRLIGDQELVGGAEPGRAVGRAAGAVPLDRRDQLLLLALGAVPGDASTALCHGPSISRLMGGDGRSSNLMGGDGRSSGRGQATAGLPACHP